MSYRTPTDEFKSEPRPDRGRGLSARFGRMTISQRFMVNIVGSLTVLALLGAFAHIELRRTSSVASQVSQRSLPGMYTIGQVQSVAHETSMLVLKDIFSVSEEQREEFAGRIRTNTGRLKVLEAQYRGTLPPEEDHARFDHFVEVMAEYTGAVEALLKLTAAEKAQEAMELKQSKLDPAFQRVMELVDKEVEATKTRAHDDGAAVDHLVKQASRVLDAGIAFAIAAGLLVGVVVIRTTKSAIRRVARNVEETVKAVHENVGQNIEAAKCLADGAIQQTVALEHTGEALSGMSALSQQTAQGARSAKELSDLTRTSAEKGLEEVAQLNTAVTEIQTSSKNVAAIIKTIDEISFQTNILALNAAVEAARAGEAGLGFAVVADEVRNLAMRCAQAAKETSARISESIDRSNRGRTVSDLVSQRLSDIAGHARRTDEVVAQIASAAEEQRKGVGQIHEAIAEVERVINQNTEGAEKAGSSAETLRSETETLNSVVCDLLILIQGAKRSESSTVPAATAEHAHETRVVQAAARAEAPPVPTGFGSRTVSLRASRTTDVL